MSQLISVIIAEHNTKIDYLKSSINSILNQTYKNFELIIVDDNTLKENRNYLYCLQKDYKNVRIISNNNNLGLAASLNKAIEVSSGDYIFRMDTDDIAYEDRFEKQLEILKTGIPVTTARVMLIDEFDNVIGKTKFTPLFNFIKRIQLYYCFQNAVIHPLIAAKREVFDEFKYDENIKYGQDFELWIRMSRKYKIYFDTNILLKYRIPSKVNINKLRYQRETQTRVIQNYLGKNLFKKIGYYIYRKIKI